MWISVVLPAPLRPSRPDDLSGIDLEVDAVENGDSRFKGTVDVGEGEHAHSDLSLSSSSRSSRYSRTASSGLMPSWWAARTAPARLIRSWSSFSTSSSSWARALTTSGLPGPALEDAVAFEQVVGLGDGHRVDAEFGGKGPGRGELVAGSEHAAGDVEADLVHDLAKDRYAARRVDHDQHGGEPDFCEVPMSGIMSCVLYAY